MKPLKETIREEQNKTKEVMGKTVLATGATQLDVQIQNAVLAGVEWAKNQALFIAPALEIREKDKEPRKEYDFIIREYMARIKAKLTNTEQ